MKEESAKARLNTEGNKARFSLSLDGAICLADSYEFTIYHCTGIRLKAFRHE